MKETHYSLRTSLVALLLCFVMLVGTTFAWFTDEVTSSNNIIKSGSLDIGFKWSADNATWIDVETDTTNSAIFDYDNWEPGYTEVRYLKVTNEGNLSFKYQMFINPTGTVGKLAEVIDVSWDIVTGNQNFVAPTADNKTGSLTKVDTLDKLVGTSESVAGGVLLPANVIETNYYSGEIVICVAFHMQETAGNDYQDKSIGDSFGINLYATQYDYENDSFDNQYDDNAEWPDRDTEVNTTFTIPNNKLINGYLTEDLTVYSDIPGVYAVLPEGVKFDKFEDLKFVIKANVDSPVTDDAGSSLLAKDVHIDGVAEDNTQPMIVYLGAILPTGLDATSLKLYHEDALMTKVDGVDKFAINNQFTYDPATGEVAVYVDSFSVFSAIETKADKWEDETEADTTWYNENDTEFVLADVADFLGFRDLVDGGNTFEGKTVKLGADINLNRKVFDPIGFGYYDDDNSDGKTNYRVFMGTFDGGNHTIYNLYENGWELDPDKTNYSTYTYSTAGAGLFASIKDATIKNLMINGAEIVFECVDMGIVVGYAQGKCHFENIVVANANIANYNRYTGGLVGEVSGGSYGIDISKGYSHTFKNITVDSTVTVSGLWGSFGCGMGGVIGGKWGNATVKMENVISAPEMDVYNDVVSAYQWYAFRGCGMLIGHTEEPYSDGRHSGKATASFLTCVIDENGNNTVKVYYGDWVRKTYYKFTNQDVEWQNNYPWVRAEAGNYCDAFSNIRYGIPVIDGVTVNKDNADALADEIVEIPFDQLYGADRGMYGQSEHPGVTVLRAEEITKTVYFENNKKWEKVYIYYWCQNGNDEWDNCAFPGQEMKLVSSEGIYDVYSFKVPVYAKGFVFSNGKDVEEAGHYQSVDIMVDATIENKLFYLNAIDNNQVVDGEKVNYKYSIYSTQYKEGYKTVSFQNNWKWKSVKIHYWANNNGFTEYDKTVLTQKINNGTYDVYTVKIPLYADGFKFSGTKNDNTNTTEDTPDISLSTAPEGGKYYLIYTSSKKLVCDTDTATYRIYFKNSYNWSSNNVYVYFGDSNGKWPGKKMTKFDGSGNTAFYYIDVPIGTTLLVFNNNGKGQQTTDITKNIQDGAVFTIEWDGDDYNGKDNGIILQ